MPSARIRSLVARTAPPRALQLGSLLLVGAALAVGAPPAAAQFTLAVKRDFTIGGAPQAQALGDVNGDCRPDLVVANTTGNSVAVLPGVAGGGFGVRADFSVGAGPAHLALADLNGDGRLDIATANTGTTTISLLFGNGFGTFSGRTDLTAGSAPRSVLAEDFNGDERPDLVVTNISGNNLSVFLARVGGGFDAKVDYATGVQPLSSAALDYNQDGRLDLVVANTSSNTISLFPGDGRGAFGARTDLATGASPRALAVGDLNGDALPDVVVPNFTSNNVSVFLGNGAGLGARTDFVTANGPLAVGLGDVTGDDLPDIVAASLTLGGVSLLPGTGAGAFGAKVDMATGTNPRAVNLLDLTGDGTRDIVVANFGSNNVSVVENGATFTTGLLLARNDLTGLTGANRVTSGDVTQDGHVELVVTSPAGFSGLTVLQGLGDGTFPLRKSAGGSNLGETALEDLNGDGLVDLVSAGNSDLTVQLGTGGGHFANPVTYPVNVGSIGLIMVDVNADGFKDAVVQQSLGSTFSVLLSAGDGTFGTAGPYTTAAALTGLTVGQFTTDANLDVLTANGTANSLSVFPGNGLGSFLPRTDIALAAAPRQVLSGDLNDDGRTDLVVIYNASSTLSVYLGTGSGLGARTDLALGGTPNAMALARITPDETLDLVLVGSAPAALWLLPGDGRGGFGPRADFPGAAGGTHLAVSDLSGDGRPDVVTVSNTANMASIHLARTPVQVALAVTPSSVAAGSLLALEATVTAAPGGGTPVGTVRFYDGLTPVGSATLAGGRAATFVTLGLAGRHDLSAVYSGVGNWFSGISAPRGVRVVASAAPALFSIADIKSDQGKQVRLKFSGSGFDYNGSPAPISSYLIYRKSTSAFAATTLRAEGATRDLAAPPRLAPAGAELSGWDFVMALPATADGPYEIVAPTLADSNTTGIHRATFMVRAATPSAGLYYDSAPDSGYSVDNLPPAPPAALAGAWTGSATALNWNDNSEADLWHYRVYRGGSAGFTPGAGNLVATRATSDFADAGQVGQFYKVSAMDVNGNESGFTLLTPSSTTGVDDGAMPLALVLRAVPRERSGGRLLVRVALPTAEPARLDLLDVSGRQVAAVDAGALGAGEHEVDLGAGRVVASGVYFVRLTQGGEMRTMRVVAAR